MQNSSLICIVILYLYYIFHATFIANKNCSIAAHPWLQNDSRHIPLDILIYKLVKSYLHASPFKRAALKVIFLYLQNACSYISLYLFILLSLFHGTNIFLCTY